MQHPDWVSCVAFSPDGTTVLTGCADGGARLWDSATGEPIGKPMRHSNRVKSVAFSPDGKTILTGCYDNTAQLWDAVALERVGRDLEHQATVWCVAFSPDGHSILTGSVDGTARLWDSEVAQPVGRLLDSGSYPSVVAFSIDSKTLVIGSRPGRIQRWEVASGRLLGQPVDYGNSAKALSPDGKTIVTADMDQVLRLSDTGTGQPIGEPMRHPDWVSSVQFSPDGRTVITACLDGEARLWDSATGRPVGEPMRHSERVTSVAISPDGKKALTGSVDKQARLWDIATGRPAGPAMTHSGTVTSVVFSPDGKMILTGSNDKTAQVWDAASGRPIGKPLANPDPVSSVAFSPDGKTIATSCLDRTTRLWDAVTGQPIGSPLPHSGSRTVFSPNGRFLLTIDASAAYLWDAPTPLPDDVPWLSAWVKATTGLELDERGSIRVLDRTAWQESRRRLEDLGGPPPADPAPRSDPILFGDKPEARGDAWKERRLWDRAEAAYSEAIHAHPLNVTLRYALARFQLEHGHPDRAAATLEEAFRMMPDDTLLGSRLCRIRLWMGDLAGWRKLNAELLDRFGQTDFDRANIVAAACSLGPDGAADPEAPVRLAEVAVRNARSRPGDFNPNIPIYLHTLGGALYRAGRWDDALRRIEEAMQIGHGMSESDFWPLLAMVHHRLGHHDQARQWLARLLRA